MRNSQSGFTLIELVMVIVILGILAATALPKFIDLETEAQQGVTEGVAGSLASASAINYAACALNDHDNTKTNCTQVADCDDLTGLVEGVTFGTGKGNYSVTGTFASGAADGESAACTVGYCTAASSCATITSSFNAIRAGNP